MESYVLQTPVGPRVRLNDKEYDYFCGTSYYCLHGHPQIIQAACEATMKYGLGPATSWNVPPLMEVEEIAAKFFSTPRAKYIVSAYLGIFFLANALIDKYDIIFVDELSHYSVFDGIKSTGKPIITYGHLDPMDLQEKLQKYLKPGQVPMVVTDGVFPMTGAMAPIPEYYNILIEYDKFLLCIDDSHGVGVLGSNGRGICEFYNLSDPRVYFCGTASKAFGGFGGIIPGGNDLMQAIEEKLRVPLGASPPPIPAAAASATGIKLVLEHPEWREQLRDNVFYIRKKLRALGLSIPESPVPIVTIFSIPNVDLAKVQKRLEENGVMVRYIPPRGYSDAPPVESLKITIFAQHSREQLDRLCALLSKIL